MEFNVSKCKVLHFGKNNPLFSYTMKGTELESINLEKVIGVLISENLNPTAHVKEAVWKAFGVLYQISSTFNYRDKIYFMKLYNQFVRPHLEISVPS